MRVWQLFVGGLLSLSAAGALPACAQSQYVAMGSSYASGPGILPVADDAGAASCARSSANYAHLLARRRHLALTDVSCSGATTGNVLDHGQHGAPAQIEAVTGKTQWVSVTIGGNNVFFIGTLGALACRDHPSSESERVSPRCMPPSPEKVEAAFAGLERSMQEVAAAVRRRAPAARLVFVGYLHALPPQGTCADLGITSAEADRVRAIARRLDTITARAARSQHAEFLDMASVDRGHDACSQAPWTSGFWTTSAEGTQVRTAVAFHPNAAGMEAVEAALERRFAGSRP